MSQSEDDPTDRHLTWVPLPLARDLLRATHEAYPERSIERFMAALQCWETLCKIAACVAEPAPSFDAVCGGTFGVWAAAVDRRLGRGSTASSSPRQEALRRWLEEALGRKGGGGERARSGDVTKTLLALLPNARNQLTAAHGPPTAHIAHPDAPRLMLAALAEVLDEERLLPRSTTLVWVNGVSVDAEQRREATGFVLRGTEAKRLREAVPAEVQAGRLYVRGEIWRPLAPWMLALDTPRGPRVLLFSKGDIGPKRELQAKYFDVVSKERVQLRELGDVGRLAQAGLADTRRTPEPAPRETPRAPDEAAAADTPLPAGSRQQRSGGLGAGLRVLVVLVALVPLGAACWAFVASSRQAAIARTVPLGDWRRAAVADAAEWSLLCRQYEATAQPTLAVFACDQAIATASATNVRAMLVRRVQLAQSTKDRDAARRTLADPRIGRFDDTLEALTAWTCADVDHSRVTGFVGYRVLRATAEKPIDVFTGTPRKQAAGKPRYKLEEPARHLVVPTCAAVGSPSISPDLEPTTWLHIDLPELMDGKWPGVVPVSAIGPSDADAARLCGLRLGQGRVSEAKRECAIAAWSDDETSRRVGIAGMIRALHQQNETNAELDWLASATKVEPAEEMRVRVQTACVGSVGEQLKTKHPNERFQLVTWQWQTRSGSLNSRSKQAALDNQKTDVRRGTCVLVDPTDRVGTMSRARVILAGKEAQGWIDDVVLSP
jgi:hypothetical protein